MSMVLALGLLIGGGGETSVAVENRSGEAVQLTVEHMPTHYPEAPRMALAPGTSDRIASADGKVILPHDRAAADLVTLRYLDQLGNGCVFSTSVVRHTAAWSKLKPSAMPIKRGKCEAGTGRTIGDFVYVIR